MSEFGLFFAVKNMCWGRANSELRSQPNEAGGKQAEARTGKDGASEVTGGFLDEGSTWVVQVH